MARTRFSYLLEQQIHEAVQQRSASLARGDASSYDQYKWHCGYIHGLLEAIKICDQLEQETDSEHRSTS